VALARRTGFAFSCRPEQGELLRLLARGVGSGAIGETGTGCGALAHAPSPRSAAVASAAQRVGMMAR